MSNRIHDNVFVGDLSDCPHWKGLRINVMLPHQLCPIPVCYPMKSLDPELDPSGARVRFPVENLDAIADKIEECRLTGKGVLVHCAAGIERSPLSIAWWMAKYQGFKFDKAYDLVLRLRPEAQDRRQWVR